jgi:hypothetical protein
MSDGRRVNNKTRGGVPIAKWPKLSIISCGRFSFISLKKIGKKEGCTKSNTCAKVRRKHFKEAER